MNKPYLYRFTELSTGMQYIGGRWAVDCFPEETCYYTSSEIVKPLILANPDNWIKEILCIGETDYIKELENKYLKLVDARNNPLYYNKCNADGNFTHAGCKHSNAAKAKMSKAHVGVPAVGKGAKGMPNSGKAAKGYSQGPQTGKAAKGNPGYGKNAKGVAKPKVLCPYCNKVGGISQMKRWHFDKCKTK